MNGSFCGVAAGPKFEAGKFPHAGPVSTGRKKPKHKEHSPHTRPAANSIRTEESPSQHFFIKESSSVWTLYRREWTLGRRTREIDKAAECATREPNTLPFELTEYLDTLSESDRSLLFQIYWQGHDERELASFYQITQQGVNKRKNVVFKRLQKLLKDSRSRGISRECESSAHVG